MGPFAFVGPKKIMTAGKYLAGTATRCGNTWLKYLLVPKTSSPASLELTRNQAETFHGNDWFKADTKNHGTSGPLHIAPMDLAPISHLMLDSMESSGLPLQHDMFTTGDNPHACGHVPRTVYKGVRTTGADFLRGGNRNLRILTDTLVDKVILEQVEGSLRATGVQVVDRDGDRTVVKVRKEVIISGGAYCSPPILLRSGIGPKEELEQVGVECRIDLPGVGKNLMDHLVCTSLSSIPSR